MDAIYRHFQEVLFIARFRKKLGAISAEQVFQLSKRISKGKMSFHLAS